jgi:hypothetical protein
MTTSRITTPRPWKGSTHLETTIEGDAGAIHITPLRADDIHFDIAWSSSFPANERTARNGSRVLDIGRGIEARAIGNVKLVDGAWVVSHFNGSQYDPTGRGRDLTGKQEERARALIAEMIGEWARTHEGDLAQADDIDRNNAAHVLEKNIAQHEEALAELRSQLAACEEGEPFARYPKLPTDA